MKNFIVALLLLLMITPGFSQNKRERIKSLKVAFITERLELTPEEAQQFWPVYNEFESTRENLRQQMALKKRNMDFKNLSETEAKATVQEIIAHEEQKTKNETEFLKHLMNAIPAKKIIMLKVAEEKFKQRMLEELRKRRRN